MARSSAAASVLAAAAAASVALAADRSISTDRTAANVSAHNGQLVWSRVGRDGRSRLVERKGNRNRDARVRPKPGLFDPDLGSNRRGNRVIVFTRCAGVSGKACDVWLLDYARARRGRERKLPGASSRRCSEFAPSVWIGAVAFARSGPHGCNGLYLARPGGRPRRLDTRVPAQTDLRGRHVAYLHIPSGNPNRTFIRIRDVSGGRSRVVVAGFEAEGESFRVSNPVLAEPFVYWLHEDRARRELFVGRSLARRRSSLEFSDRSLPGRVDAIAVTRDLLFYTNGNGLFRATDPVMSFSARD
jgi:hypothetical protein